MGSSSVVLLLAKSKPKWPSVDAIRNFKGNFGGIVIPELQYGFDNKVLFTPGYVVESSSVRKIIRERYKAAGFTHFPINLYNTTSIYHDYYPQWDDRKINDYLTELLSDGIIPVGSAFADNVKVVKPVVDPDLVPAVFTGWENPAPILYPALDADNLFYVAKQYFPKSLVYWHNPSYQGAPYVSNTDWGYSPSDDINHIVWQYMVYNSGCQGLLNQGNGWENSGSDSVARLIDFRDRLIYGENYWPKADLVDFEEVVYYNTTLQGSPLLTGESIRNRVTGLTGYCNG